MFGIKSLKERIDALEQKLQFAQRDILNLQNPYKFKIGDKITAEAKQDMQLNVFPIKYDGTIVGIEYRFVKKAPYFVSEERVNIYKVFNSASKTTHDLSDNWYQIELK